ncbi:MAG: sensor histidine kinase [Gemmatimonadota bacterium]
MGTVLRAYFVGTLRGLPVTLAVFALICFTISGIMELGVPLVDRLVRRRTTRVQLLAYNLLYVLGGGAGFAAAFGMAHLLFGVGQTDTHVVTWLGAAGAGLISVFIGNMFYTYERLRENLRASEAGLAREAVERERLEKLRAEAELSALQARINPHFLFNTLNSLAALIPVDPGAAEEMTQRLSDCFRYVLQASHGPVALEEEMRFVEDYLSLERLRFGERLGVRVALEPEARAQRLPGLAVQPLVENALKHGIAPLERGGHVAVDARRAEDSLVIVVEDDGRGLRGLPEAVLARGTGLANVRARLRSAFGPDAGLTIEPRTGGGTRVTLRLPWREAPARALGPALPAALEGAAR